MAFRAMNSIGGKSGQAIADTSTTQNAPVLTRVQAVDSTYGEAEFVYLKGILSTAVGSVVTYKADGTTALATTRSKGNVAIAMSANATNLNYGWYQIWGRGVAKAATVVSGAPVYATGTPGTLDDTVVAGDLVYGATFNTADGTPSAGLAEVTLAFPFLGDTDNA